MNVGAGVLQKMEELGDRPIKDSNFYENTDHSTTEFGYGYKYDYRASNTSGDWEVMAYALPLVD